jgi:hypothetical protein
MWRWRRAPDRSDVAPYPAPARADWRRLPPVQRLIGEHPLVSPPERFTAALTSWQTPSFLAPLGHNLGTDEPSGVVHGLLETASPRSASRADGPDMAAATRQGDRGSWRAVTGTLQRLLFSADAGAGVVEHDRSTDASEPRMESPAASSVPIDPPTETAAARPAWVAPLPVQCLADYVSAPSVDAPVRQVPVASEPEPPPEASEPAHADPPSDDAAWTWLGAAPEPGTGPVASGTGRPRIATGTPATGPPGASGGPRRLGLGAPIVTEAASVHSGQSEATGPSVVQRMRPDTGISRMRVGPPIGVPPVAATTFATAVRATDLAGPVAADGRAGGDGGESDGAPADTEIAAEAAAAVTPEAVATAATEPDSVAPTLASVRDVSHDPTDAHGSVTAPPDVRNERPPDLIAAGPAPPPLVISRSIAGAAKPPRPSGPAVAVPDTAAVSSAVAQRAADDSPVAQRAADDSPVPAPPEVRPTIGGILEPADRHAPTGPGSQTTARVGTDDFSVPVQRHPGEPTATVLPTASMVATFDRRTPDAGPAPFRAIRPAAVDGTPSAPLQRLVASSSAHQPATAQREAATPASPMPLVGLHGSPAPGSARAAGPVGGPVSAMALVAAPGSSTPADVVTIVRTVTASVQRAADPVDAAPSAEPDIDGSPATIEPVVEQPVPGPPSTVTAMPGVTAASVAGAEPEEMLKKLFDPLLRRLKAELRVDRDRQGLVTDLWC